MFVSAATTIELVRNTNRSVVKINNLLIITHP